MKSIYTLYKRKYTAFYFAECCISAIGRWFVWNKLSKETVIVPSYNELGSKSKIGITDSQKSDASLDA